MGAYLPCWSPAGRAPWLGDTSCVIRGTVGPPGTAVYSCVCDDFESIALQRCLDTCQWLVVNGWWLASDDNSNSIKLQRVGPYGL